jgi:hypothetical protein
MGDGPSSLMKLAEVGAGGRRGGVSEGRILDTRGSSQVRGMPGLGKEGEGRRAERCKDQAGWLATLAQTR